MDLWRDIVDSLHAAVLALSSGLELREINQAGENLLGVSPASSAVVRELIGRNQWLLDMLRACLLHGEDLSSAEASLVLTGREVAVRAEVSPLIDESGQISGVVLLIHDLSHERGAAHLVNDAEEADLGLSAAGLAHEVKNPLTGIKGAAELMARLFPADNRAQQYCGLILDGVNRVAGLVEQVLSVSGPQRLRQEPVNIHQVLHQALALAGLYPQPRPGIVVEQEFDPSLPEIMGDAPALERVFLNLLKNAIDAIESAGTIRLRTRIETRFRRTPGGARRRFLRVELSDSGKGLTATEMANLFRPFYTTKLGGTGLGLVLSQRIIAMHGGKIWAESGSRRGGSRTVPDEADPRADDLSGLTFKVTLPIVQSFGQWNEPPQ